MGATVTEGPSSVTRLTKPGSAVAKGGVDRSSLVNSNVILPGYESTVKSYTILVRSKRLIHRTRGALSHHSHLLSVNSGVTHDC